MAHDESWSLVDEGCNDEGLDDECWDLLHSETQGAPDGMRTPPLSPRTATVELKMPCGVITPPITEEAEADTITSWVESADFTSVHPATEIVRTPSPVDNATLDDSIALCEARQNDSKPSEAEQCADHDCSFWNSPGIRLQLVSLLLCALLWPIVHFYVPTSTGPITSANTEFAMLKSEMIWEMTKMKASIEATHRLGNETFHDVLKIEDTTKQQIQLAQDKFMLQIESEFRKKLKNLKSEIKTQIGMEEIPKQLQLARTEVKYQVKAEIESGLRTRLMRELAKEMDGLATIPRKLRKLKSDVKADIDAEVKKLAGQIEAYSITRQIRDAKKEIKKEIKSEIGLYNIPKQIQMIKAEFESRLMKAVGDQLAETKLELAEDFMYAQEALSVDMKTAVATASSASATATTAASTAISANTSAATFATAVASAVATCENAYMRLNAIESTAAKQQPEPKPPKQNLGLPTPAQEQQARRRPSSTHLNLSTTRVASEPPPLPAQWWHQHNVDLIGWQKQNDVQPFNNGTNPHLEGPTTVQASTEALTYAPTNKLIVGTTSVPTKALITSQWWYNHSVHSIEWLMQSDEQPIDNGTNLHLGVPVLVQAGAPTYAPTNKLVKALTAFTPVNLSMQHKLPSRAPTPVPSAPYTIASPVDTSATLDLKNSSIAGPFSWYEQLFFGVRERKDKEERQTSLLYQQYLQSTQYLRYLFQLQKRPSSPRRVALQPQQQTHNANEVRFESLSAIGQSSAVAQRDAMRRIRRLPTKMPSKFPTKMPTQPPSKTPTVASITSPTKSSIPITSRLPTNATDQIIYPKYLSESQLKPLNDPRSPIPAPLTVTEQPMASTALASWSAPMLPLLYIQGMLNVGMWNHKVATETSASNRTTKKVSLDVTSVNSSVRELYLQRPHYRHPYNKIDCLDSRRHKHHSGHRTQQDKTLHRRKLWQQKTRYADAAFQFCGRQSDYNRVLQAHDHRHEYDKIVREYSTTDNGDFSRFRPGSPLPELKCSRVPSRSMRSLSS